MYLVSEYRDLPDPTAFEYGDRIHVESIAGELSVKKVGGIGDVDVHVVDSENESSAEIGEKNSEL